MWNATQTIGIVASQEKQNCGKQHRPSKESQNTRDQNSRKGGSKRPMHIFQDIMIERKSPTNIIMAGMIIIIRRNGFIQASCRGCRREGPLIPRTLKGFIFVGGMMIIVDFPMHRRPNKTTTQVSPPQRTFASGFDRFSSTIQNILF